MLETNFTVVRKKVKDPGVYVNLTHKLGGPRKYGAKKPITMMQVLEAAGLEKTLEVMETCPGHEQPVRLFACKCVEEFLPMYEAMPEAVAGPRSIVTTAKTYALGLSSDQELGDVARKASFELGANPKKENEVFHYFALSTTVGSPVQAAKLSIANAVKFAAFLGISEEETKERLAEILKRYLEGDFKARTSLDEWLSLPSAYGF